MNADFKHVILHIWTSMFCQLWKRRAPKNPKESSDEISKITEMGPISIKKHECIFANMVQVSITKHNDVFEMLILSGSIFCESWGHQNNIAIFVGPKQSSLHRVFINNEF